MKPPTLEGLGPYSREDHLILGFFRNFKMRNSVTADFRKSLFSNYLRKTVVAEFRILTFMRNSVNGHENTAPGSSNQGPYSRERPLTLGFFRNFKMRNSVTAEFRKSLFSNYLRKTVVAESRILTFMQNTPSFPRI